MVSNPLGFVWEVVIRQRYFLLVENDEMQKGDEVYLQNGWRDISPSLWGTVIPTPNTMRPVRRKLIENCIMDLKEVCYEIVAITPKAGEGSPKTRK